jgi:hypothetical protein
MVTALLPTDLLYSAMLAGTAVSGMVRSRGDEAVTLVALAGRDWSHRLVGCSSRSAPTGHPDRPPRSAWRTLSSLLSARATFQGLGRTVPRPSGRQAWALGRHQVGEREPAATQLHGAVRTASLSGAPLAPAAMRTLPSFDG